MSELKPCPFCGGEAKAKESLRSFTSELWETYVYVVCKKCGATVEGADEAEAIETWNTRATDYSQAQVTHCCPCGAQRTCRIDDSGYCDCGYPLGDWVTWRMDDRQAYLYERANFCPHCGARVKEETDAD